MSTIGKVDSVWRYPVKSMRGEELDQAFVDFSGVYGDRLFAFASSASPKGFPYLTGREQQQMIRYRPRFRDPEKAAQPINLTEAKAIAPFSVRRGRVGRFRRFGPRAWQVSSSLESGVPQKKMHQRLVEERIARHDYISN